MSIDRTPPTDGKMSRASQDWLATRGKTTGWRHAGIDIFSTPGQAIYAPENGTVYTVADETKTAARGHYGGYGPRVVGIAGDSGFFHWLAHLQTTVVEKGDVVLQGQAVGTMVAGWTHPHVHWEVRQKPFCKYSLNPATKFEGIQERFPWVITIDPYRWLQGLQLTPGSALLGVPVGKDVPTDRLRPGGYPYDFNHTESILAPDYTDPLPSMPTVAVKAGPSAALVVVAILAAGAGIWYAKKKRIF
jgi:murein DD-endopeptidase MepM/ murein hydrolase activator NlpD